MGQLDKEHVLLLVDELVDVLRALLTRELHPRLGDVSGAADDASLAHVEVVQGVVTLRRQDVCILDTLERHARCRSLLVPDLQMLGSLLCFLLLLLLSFTLDEHLLFVGWSERRVLLSGTALGGVAHHTSLRILVHTIIENRKR